MDMVIQSFLLVVIIMVTATLLIKLLPSRLQLPFFIIVSIFLLTPILAPQQ
jgi:hypothetical protein